MAFLLPMNFGDKVRMGAPELQSWGRARTQLQDGVPGETRVRSSEFDSGGAIGGSLYAGACEKGVEETGRISRRIPPSFCPPNTLSCEAHLLTFHLCSPFLLTSSPLSLLLLLLHLLLFPCLSPSPFLLLQFLLPSYATPPLFPDLLSTVTLLQFCFTLPLCNHPIRFEI